MTPLSSASGRAHPLDRDHCDTDTIFPARYMDTLSRSGLGRFAFESLRARSEISLDHMKWRNAPFLVVGENFGCGSSREHAVWAIRDLGIRVIIGKSFADIFAQNAGQNGIATITLPAADVDRFFVSARAGDMFSISLETMILTVHDERFPVELNDRLRARLLVGADEIAETLQSVLRIEQKERTLAHSQPWAQFADRIGQHR